MSGNLLASLVEAAESVGDSGFYLKGYVFENPDILAWHIPFIEVSKYTDADSRSNLGTATSFEQTLISPSGQWAIVTSHEKHMLLASNRKFIKAFTPLIPNLDNQVFCFLENWREICHNDGTDVSSWLPGLIMQVYGEQKGIELLQNYQLLQVDG